MRSKRCAVGFWTRPCDSYVVVAGGQSVVGSGRYLVARSQVPGTKSEEGEGEGGGLCFPRGGRPQITIKLGRQTAGCRIAERRECLNAGHGWLVGPGASKTKSKGQ